MVYLRIAFGSRRAGQEYDGETSADFLYCLRPIGRLRECSEAVRLIDNRQIEASPRLVYALMIYHGNVKRESAFIVI